MEENKFEILKRKRIRKMLLLKINDELKEISKHKSNIRINSKTIQELNQLYNRSDILLFEKSMIYSNYIKTEETIIAKNISPINITKTLDIPRTKRKIKYDEEIKNYKYEVNSLDEDSTSPVINYVPKKIELGRKKLNKNKSKSRNNGSVPHIHKTKVVSDKQLEAKSLDKSIKLGCDFRLHKLIEKITLIKHNENTEGKIRENIKKLRNYCYQLRKKKKKLSEKQLQIIVLENILRIMKEKWKKIYLKKEIL